MITIDLLKHEQDQAEEIADRLFNQMIDGVVLGPPVTLDQIRYIWMRVAERAREMNKT
jgi:hypothetical protein